MPFSSVIFFSDSEQPADNLTDTRPIFSNSEQPADILTDTRPIFSDSDQPADNLTDTRPTAEKEQEKEWEPEIYTFCYDVIIY